MQGIHLGKYGVARTIDFELYEPTGVDLYSTALAAADVEIQTDGGNFAQSTNASATEDGTYSLELSTGEMTGARVVVKIVDVTGTKVFLDKIIVVETYGNASAQHAMDLDDAVRGGMTALPAAVPGEAGGVFIAGTNAATAITTGLTTTFTGDLTGKVDGTVTGKTPIETGDTLARVTLVDTATTVTGGAAGTKQDTAQTDLDKLTGADGATLASLQGNYAPNVVVPDVAGTAPTVNEIWAKAMSDLAQGAPAKDAPVLTALNFIYEAWRNKTTTTSSLVTVFKDDGTTELVRCTISDDGTTFTKAEIVTGV